MELAPPADQRDLGIEGRFRRNAQREPDCFGTRRTDCKQCNYQLPSLEAGDIKSGTGEYGEGDGTKLKKCYGAKLALYTDIFERRGLARSKRPFVWDIHREEVTYDLDEPQGKRDQDAYEVSRLQLAGHSFGCVGGQRLPLGGDRGVAEGEGVAEPDPSQGPPQQAAERARGSKATRPVRRFGSASSMSSGPRATTWAGTLVRSVGLVRAKARIGLKNLAYNMRRLVQLERLAAAV